MTKTTIPITQRRHHDRHEKIKMILNNKKEKGDKMIYTRMLLAIAECGIVLLLLLLFVCYVHRGADKCVCELN